jgi:catechol 2,3-dioxygenase-like lactoylglutathione lyase family enzyme
MQVESLSAITLATHDMAKSLGFYATLGFRTVWSAPDGSFATIRAGDAWINLFMTGSDTDWRGWGRFILHVDDVDAFHERLLEVGYEPQMAPSDAPWGERYFHVLDPDGHEVSLAKRFRPVRGNVEGQL